MHIIKPLVPKRSRSICVFFMLLLSVMFFRVFSFVTVLDLAQWSMVNASTHDEFRAIWDQNYDTGILCGTLCSSNLSGYRSTKKNQKQDQKQSAAAEPQKN